MVPDTSSQGGSVKQATKPFALCVDNTDYKASLILGKWAPTW